MSLWRFVRHIRVRGRNVESMDSVEDTFEYALSPNR